MKRSKRLAGLLGSATLSVVVGTAALASAQERIAGGVDDRLDIGQLRVAPAGDRFFGVPSAYVNGDLTPHVMVLVDYAHNPLVLRKDPDTRVGAIVGNQFVLHANASLALLGRLLVDVDMPFALHQSGDNPSAVGLTFPSPSGTAVGDLRLGMRVPILGDHDSLFQLAVGGAVWLPTGTGDFVTDGEVRGMPQAIIGGQHDRFVYSFSIGTPIRATKNYFGSVAQGTSFLVRGGLGVRVGAARNVQLGPEFAVSTVMKDPTPQNTNAEVLLGAKYRVGGVVEAGLGAGMGLTTGVGTPDMRLVASIAYTPAWKPRDGDRDGIPDEVDACPRVSGVASAHADKNGCPLERDGGKVECPSDVDQDGIPDAQDACPALRGVRDSNASRNGCPPDADGDGISDESDACPSVAGVADPSPQKNGCPADADGDGIPDAKDACPDIRGIETSDAATNGCPGDTDADSIRDDKDACPTEKGTADPDPKLNGCPKARMTETQVVILKQVQFDTAAATILPASDVLLDEIAGVLKANPELLEVEVQGHTDSQGKEWFNTKLSRDRAGAVRKALIDRNIDQQRLIARGYGSKVPIRDNDTEEGRQANRRVQLVIRKKKLPDGSIKRYDAQPTAPATK